MLGYSEATGLQKEAAHILASGRRKETAGARMGVGCKDACYQGDAWLGNFCAPSAECKLQAKCKRTKDLLETLCQGKTSLRRSLISQMINWAQEGGGKAIKSCFYLGLPLK